MSTDSEIVAFQEGRIAELEDSLQFVERWAVHHGTKSHMTAENALSVIQHYPPISAITKSYADGKIPDTFNPFTRITELEAQLADTKKDADLMSLLKTARYELDACQAVIHLAGGFDPAYVSGAQKVLKAIDAAIAKRKACRSKQSTYTTSTSGQMAHGATDTSYRK